MSLRPLVNHKDHLCKYVFFIKKKKNDLYELNEELNPYLSKD